jgi:hypothetical protein
MKGKIFAARVLAVAWLLIMASEGTVFAGFIPINNPSFEEHLPYTKAISISNINNNIYTEVYVPYTVPEGSREWIDSIVGWYATQNTGTVKFESTYYPSGIPDRVNVAFNNGGVISQTLSEILSPNTTYELETFVGYRVSAAYPFPGYSIQFLAGGNLLASDNNSLNPAGFFLPSKVTYTTASTDPNIGQFLQIKLISNGIQTNFDNVSLKATSIPEPTTILLFGLGLIGLAGVRRKIKQ